MLIVKVIMITHNNSVLFYMKCFKTRLYQYKYEHLICFLQGVFENFTTKPNSIYSTTFSLDYQSCCAIDEKRVNFCDRN